MKTTPSPDDTFQFSATLERSNNKLWGCHFRVPSRIVKELIEGDSRRVVCTLNNSVEYQCAMLPFGDRSFVISVNQDLRDTLRLTFGMEVQVSLKKDNSEYGLPLPDELQELLRQDAEGDKLFHALTRGKQRTLLYIVGAVKSPEKRVERAITIVNHLKAHNCKIDYKKLNATLKDSRR